MPALRDDALQLVALTAVEALQAEWQLPEREARLETTIAIAYASASHAEWLPDGVDGSA
jgi:hypothetical protein